MWKQTEEAKRKISEAMKARYRDPAEREKTSRATIRGMARAKALRGG